MRRGTLIKLAVSVAFLLLLGLKTDWPLFMSTLKGISGFYVVLSFLFSLAMIAASCFKWQLMLRLQGERPGFLFLMKTYFIGYFFTALLPSTVGGDVIRSFYTGKRVGDQYTAAISVFFERFSGLLLLLLLAVVTPFFHPPLLSSWFVRIPLLGSGALFVLLLVFSLNERHLDRAGALIMWAGGAARERLGSIPLLSRTRLAEAALSASGKISSKGAKFFRKVRKAAGYFNQRPSYILWTVLLTFLFYGIAWFNIFIAFRVFHVEANLLEIAALLPIIMLVSMVPITIGGIGLAEGTYVVYFSLVGMPVESAFLMSIFLRFKLMVIATVGLTFYLASGYRREDYAELLSKPPGD